MPPTVRLVNRPDGARYLTVEEAAARTGLKPRVIRNYLSEGRLVTYKFKTLTLLSVAELAAYARRQGTA